MVMGIGTPRVGEARDPQGLVVTISQSAWEHITGDEGHPEMRGRLEDVLQAIRTPTLIQASASDPEGSRIYYRLKATASGRYANLYTVVVVKVDEDLATGQVRTAYLTASPGKGRLLWMAKK